MNRIDIFSDELSDAIYKLSEGNPGAATCLVSLYKDESKTRHITFLDVLLLMDHYRIYGSQIYIIWNDLCKRDSFKTYILFMAVKLGFESPYVLREAARETLNSEFDMDSIIGMVIGKYPDFWQG